MEGHVCVLISFFTFEIDWTEKKTNFFFCIILMPWTMAYGPISIESILIFFFF